MTHWLVFLAWMVQSAGAPQDAYAPLRLYNGAWTVTARDDSGKTKTDTLVNDCAQIGLYFGCQQTVNGKPAALVLYIPADDAGHYVTRAVLPDGQSPGTGELTITGSHWVYIGHNDSADDKTMWFRTINDFQGNDRIHSESSRSSDGKTWTATGSADDTRIPAARH